MVCLFIKFEPSMLLLELITGHTHKIEGSIGLNLTGILTPKM